MTVFTCKACNFRTINSSNYSRHCVTKKHIRKQSETKEALVEVKQPKPYVCKYCEKGFSFIQSRNYHVKYHCKMNQTEDLTELVRLMNNQLHEKDKQIENQQRQIEQLMKKLNIPKIQNNYIQNNHITLLPFQDTDISHLTEQDYAKCVNAVLKCVPQLIEKLHFNPLKPENHNVYISNLKNNYAMVYDGQQWNIQPRDETINDLIEINEMRIEDWLQDQEKYPVLQTKFNMYLDKKENDSILDNIKEDIKLMMYNKRHTASSALVLEH